MFVLMSFLPWPHVSDSTVRRIFVKLGVGVLYKSVGFRHEFLENRRHDNHIPIRVVNSFLPVLSVFFSQVWRNWVQTVSLRYRWANVSFAETDVVKNHTLLRGIYITVFLRLSTRFLRFTWNSARDMSTQLHRLSWLQYNLTQRGHTLLKGLNEYFSVFPTFFFWSCDSRFKRTALFWVIT